MKVEFNCEDKEIKVGDLVIYSKGSRSYKCLVVRDKRPVELKILLIDVETSETINWYCDIDEVNSNSYINLIAESEDLKLSVLKEA